MTLRQTSIFAVTFMTLALCPVSPVRAQLVAYDGFSYAPNSSPTNASAPGGNAGFGWGGRPPGVDIWLATNAATSRIYTNPAGDVLTFHIGSTVVGVSSDATAADTRIRRGKYLVENVALCAECHTPRTDKGDYDRAQWLQGDVLDFKPVRLMPFAAAAPPIAGMPGFTDAQALIFLEAGIDLAGKPALYPMPQYRFSHDDALAVLVYLRSLKH